jgi:hypothetical protein
MGLFGRRESLHERLARKGGLGGEPAPHDTQPRWGEAGIHGVAQPRQWDAVGTVDAPDLPGDAIEFTRLPDGSLLIDDEVDADAVNPIADGLDRMVEGSYRAEGVRRDGTTWAFAARKIEVVQLSEPVDGDEIVLSDARGERTLTIDGAPAFGSLPELERLGAARHDAYVVRAQRLDADLFEVSVSPL